MSFSLSRRVAEVGEMGELRLKDIEFDLGSELMLILGRTAGAGAGAGDGGGVGVVVTGGEGEGVRF
jgi:hypothetical protein